MTDGLAQGIGLALFCLAIAAGQDLFFNEGEGLARIIRALRGKP